MYTVKWTEKYTGKLHIESFSSQESAGKRLEFLKSHGVDAWLA